MAKTDALNMLREELSKKLDDSTVKKLANAKSKKEALSILEDASIELDDDAMSAISAGSDMDEIADLERSEWCTEDGPCVRYSCVRFME